eukprot:SAG11_NODE_28043_length_326_cov_0.629956_1_plen_55_part_10
MTSETSHDGVGGGDGEPQIDSHSVTLECPTRPSTHLAVEWLQKNLTDTGGAGGGA